MSACEPSEWSVARAALEYATTWGWAVFPLNGKVPYAGTHGFKDATTEPRVEDWPADANVGIATGANDSPGGGLVVLDVDVTPELDGHDTLAELERAHGALPLTASVKTPRGGTHFYFRTRDVRARVPCSAGNLGPGVDVRAAGGYIVAPPSVHPETGRCWTWDEHPSESDIRVVPDWLLELLAPRRRERIRPVSEWRALARGGVSEGARNASCAKLAGHLLARSVDPFVTLELVTAWNRRRNRPPLGDDEVAAVVRSVAKRELQKWMT